VKEGPSRSEGGGQMLLGCRGAPRVVGALALMRGVRRGQRGRVRHGCGDVSSPERPYVTRAQTERQERRRQDLAGCCRSTGAGQGCRGGRGARRGGGCCLGSLARRGRGRRRGRFNERGAQEPR